MLRLDHFRGLVDDTTLAEIHRRAKNLHRVHVVHLNATYQGGGVAEILYPLVMLMDDVGVDAGWRILHGSQEFFEITKSFHNALQGGELKLTDAKKKMYCQVNENFSRFTHLHHDCVIIHDPQPLSLIQFYRKTQPWIWRCHIDLTAPHKALWSFLKGFIIKYDQVVVSSEKYIKEDLPVDQRLMMPAINPLSEKNREMSDSAAARAFEKAGIPTDKPIIAQVSRLDPWKDPEGVVDVFRRVKEKIDCRLVFCYNIASDDPEGYRMYNRVYRKAEGLTRKGDVLFVVGNNETLVNAVQRRSDVIIQKSIREGFCLAVTEALWKATPVVASAIGGIPLQIDDGNSGFLLEPNDNQGFADRIIHLLQDKKLCEHIGQQAREKVRRNFLITRLLSDYLDMLNSLLA